MCGWSPNVGDFTPLHRQKNSSKGCKSNRSPIYLESESVFVTCCILLLATTHRLRVARGDRSCFCSSWFRIIKIFAEWAPDSRDQPECPLCMTRSFGLGVWEGYGQRHSTLECFSLYTFPIYFFFFDKLTSRWRFIIFSCYVSLECLPLLLSLFSCQFFGIFSLKVAN